MTSIVFEIGGRGSDNFTISFEGKVPQNKCVDFIDYYRNKGSDITIEEACKFMNGEIKATSRTQSTPKTEPKVESKSDARTEVNTKISYSNGVKRDHSYFENNRKIRSVKYNEVGKPYLEKTWDELNRQTTRFID